MIFKDEVHEGTILKIKEVLLERIPAWKNQYDEENDKNDDVANRVEMLCDGTVVICLCNEVNEANEIQFLHPVFGPVWMSVDELYRFE
jgi:hypothetical protein